MGMAQNTPSQPVAAEAVLPQVACDRENYPEVMQQPEYKEQGQAPTRTTICGLRRKTFWIIAATVLLIIIGAAVGGGVGGSLAAKHSTDDKTSTSSSNANSSASATSFLPNTNLAAVNYTDGDVQHHLVFFQTTGDGIYQSAWNSSGNTWAVSPVEVKDSTDARSELFKTPTPITASYYACSSNVRKKQTPRLHQPPTH